MHPARFISLAENSSALSGDREITLSGKCLVGAIDVLMRNSLESAVQEMYIDYNRVYRERRPQIRPAIAREIAWCGQIMIS